jgi:uncharacterized membrane protein YcaP (DUF421 family)
MEIVIRSLVLYLFIWVLIRALGRKELTELSAFELLLLIVMGDLIQQGVTHEDMSLTGAMLTVSTLALITLTSSFLSFRFRKLRPIIEGISVVVLRDGELDEAAMRLERLTSEDVKEAARLQGIADIGEVRLGVLEGDGKFSFLTSSGEGGMKEQPGPDA